MNKCDENERDWTAKFSKGKSEMVEPNEKNGTDKVTDGFRSWNDGETFAKFVVVDYFGNNGTKAGQSHAKGWDEQTCQENHPCPITNR